MLLGGVTTLCIRDVYPVPFKFLKSQVRFEMTPAPATLRLDGVWLAGNHRCGETAYRLVTNFCIKVRNSPGASRRPGTYRAAHHLYAGTRSSNSARFFLLNV